MSQTQTYFSHTPTHSNVPTFEYSSQDKNGVIVLVVTGLGSLIAILYLVLVKPPKPSDYRQTHLFGYILSLLFANFLLSGSTVMSLKWVIGNQVTSGSFCTTQGALKQAGNVATALWTLILGFHLFNLLFLRTAPTKLAFWLTSVGGWSIVAIVVIVGPTAIQTAERGPYFGISGPWCWINNSYPEEQVFLQYFFELLSGGLSIILYSIVLLRVRGNLVYLSGKWKLQHMRAWDSWRLAIGKDFIDSAMLRFAQSMVWFPISYTIVLLPVSIARITSLTRGHPAPFPVIIFTDTIFNLVTVINVFLLLLTRRFYPDMDLPEFNTQRNTDNDTHARRFVLMENGGVSPFPFTRSSQSGVVSDTQNQSGRASVDHNQNQTDNRTGNGRIIGPPTFTLDRDVPNPESYRRKRETVLANRRSALTPNALHSNSASKSNSNSSFRPTAPTALNLNSPSFRSPLPSSSYLSPLSALGFHSPSLNRSNATVNANAGTGTGTGIGRTGTPKHGQDYTQYGRSGSRSAGTGSRQEQARRVERVLR